MPMLDSLMTDLIMVATSRYDSRWYNDGTLFTFESCENVYDVLTSSQGSEEYNVALMNQPSPLNDEVNRKLDLQVGLR